MKLSRPNRTTLTLSLCLLTMAGTLSYQHYRLADLTTAIAETAGKESLDAIEVSLRQIDEKFTGVDQQYLASNEDLRSGQQALSSRLDAIQGQAYQVRERVEQLDLRSASTKDIIIIKASLDDVAAHLKELQLRHSNAANTKQSSPTSSTRKATSTAKTKKPGSPPPFEVIGIEHRGGQEFLAIAPAGSSQLSQILLIRPGDAVTGTRWKLRSVDSASARFDVAGVSQIVALSR